MSGGQGSDTVVGSELAGYRIEALIGRGGMGAVYRAEETGLHRKVALKVIAPELAADERFRERFLRESRIAASLDHPHVIPIYGAGEAGGVLYLAMRHVEGSDLARVLAAEGALEPRRALELLGQVAEALDAAHAQGLVHRDVKPSNVLLAGAAGREHCYLADFGLTKRTGSLSGVSVAGDVVGTLEYVAPEQIAGESPDERADVYSLGCVLYECLTGQAPFPRATDVALLWAHVHEQPPRPSSLRPELPRALDPVLARALAKEPGRRYGSAAELMAAARTALGLAEPTRGVRRPQLLAAGLAAVAVAAIAVVATLLLRADSGGLSGVAVNSVGIVDSQSGEIRGEVALGSKPEGVAVGAGAVWVAIFEDGALQQIDPESRERLRTLRVGEYASDVAVGGGGIWVTSTETDNSIRPQAPNFLAIQNAEAFVPVVGSIDPDTASVQIAPLGEGLRCGSPAVSVAVGRTAAWYACDRHVGLIDLRTGAARRVSYEAIALTGTGGRNAAVAQFSDIAFGLGSLWLANRATNSITRIDPRTGRALREIVVGRPPSAVAVGAGAVWVASYDDDSVTRIDVRGSGGPVTTTRIAVGDGPVDVIASDEEVWAANELAGTLSRIDPGANEVVATVDTGNPPRRLALGDGRLWVTVQGDETAAQP